MRGLLVLGAILQAARPGASEEAAATPGGRSGFLGRFVADHLSIGVHMTHFWLQDTRRADAQGYDNENLTGNFLGSLWGLDAKQHYFPNPFLEYRVVSSFGVGIAYDQSRAKTLDWGNNEGKVTTFGDGDVEIRGLQYYIFGRYRNRTRLTPFASLGLARYWSRFDVSPLWLLPGRRFVVDNTQGWLVAGGCNVALGRHVGLDAFYRHLQVADVSARAYLRANHYRGGAFPMRHHLLGAGLSYAF